MAKGWMSTPTNKRIAQLILSVSTLPIYAYLDGLYINSNNSTHNTHQTHTELDVELQVCVYQLKSLIYTV
jgi:hypothetical protein